MRASELAERGAKGLPRAITRFIQRVTDPDKPAIAWNEFRDFMSNVSRLSANEYSSMNPQMAAQVGKLAGAMKDAAQGVAEAGGVGDEFSQAIQLYARSKAWQKFGAEVWAGFKKSDPARSDRRRHQVSGRKEAFRFDVRKEKRQWQITTNTRSAIRPLRGIL